MYLGNKQYGATAATGVKGDMLASSQWVSLSFTYYYSFFSLLWKTKRTSLISKF